MMAYVLVHGKTQQEHKDQLMHVLSKLCLAGVTLKDKYRISQKSDKFIEHVVAHSGIQPNQVRTQAMSET